MRHARRRYGPPTILLALAAAVALTTYYKEAASPATRTMIGLADSAIEAGPR